jgi:hypothetical protein
LVFEENVAESIHRFPDTRHPENRHPDTRQWNASSIELPDERHRSAFSSPLPQDDVQL